MLYVKVQNEQSKLLLQFLILVLASSDLAVLLWDGDGDRLDLGVRLQPVLPQLPTLSTMHTWEVTPGNKPPKIPQNSHFNGV